jgi:protein O-GlcNAc transferase
MKPMYIFVSGFGHAGTTLMTVMLGSHPDTHLIPYETRWFLWGDNSDEAIAYAKNIDKPYIVEKTPMHVRKIEQMHEHFSDAKFIVMVRNPYDVIASQYKRHGDIDKAINRMKIDFEHIEKSKNLNYVKIVSYEDLLENTQSALNDICKFLEIKFYEEMLDYHKENIAWEGVEPKYSDGVGEQEHLHRRAWQVSQPLFDGRGRYKELSSKQIKYISNSIDYVIESLNYNKL